LKEDWVKTQDPTVFDKANIRAITMNVWGHSENKVWRTQGCSANKKGVGTHPKKLGILTVM